MPDAAYYREWRKAHPAYRAREVVRSKGRNHHSPGESRPSRAQPRPPLLYPDLQRGARVAFWEDELRLDLAQEHALAVLEGRDPQAAVAAYQAREIAWHAVTVVIKPWL